jgi:flagellar hook assembly protein FlgD
VFVIDGGTTTSDILEVPIQVRNFDEISAYQFTVNWNTEKLDFISVTSEGIEGLFGDNKTSEGVLTTLWDEKNGKSKNLSYEETLFKIKYRKKDVSANSKDVTINSTRTNIIAYDKNLKPVAFSIDRKSEELSNEFELYQNFPNGFDTKTQIGFNVPQQGEVSIEITDATGRKVLSLQNNYDAGKHFIEWNGTDGSGSKASAGLYIYRARYGSIMKAKKMVKN